MYRFITVVLLVGIMAGNSLAAPAVGIGMTATDRASNAGVLSAQPAGVVIPDHGGWSAFVQVKGKNFASATSVRAYWYRNDDDSKAPLMKQTATYRGHKGTDEITIQIPGNPAKSGWSGDFANGVLRIYLIMPGQKQPLFAARYTVGSVIAPSRNINSRARDITTPEISLIGSGPTSSVTTNAIAVTGSGPTSKITTNTITISGAGPVATVTTAMIAVTGSGPTSSVSVPPITVIGANQLTRRSIPPH